MKRLIVASTVGMVVTALIIAGLLYAAPQRIPSSFVTIEELDGEPSGRFNTAKFVDGVLTDNGDGTVSINWTAIINALSTIVLNNADGYGIECDAGSCNATPELFTDTGCIVLEKPKTGNIDSFYHFMLEADVVSVWCEVDVSFSNINVENDDGTPADILSAELVCDPDGQDSCSSGCDVDTIQVSEETIDPGSTVNLSISTMGAAPPPDRISVCVGYERSD